MGQAKLIYGLNEFSQWAKSLQPLKQSFSFPPVLSMIIRCCSFLYWPNALIEVEEITAYSMDGCQGYESNQDPLRV